MKMSQSYGSNQLNSTGKIIVQNRRIKQKKALTDTLNRKKQHIVFVKRNEKQFCVNAEKRNEESRKRKEEKFSCKEKKIEMIKNGTHTHTQIHQSQQQNENEIE